MQDFMEQIAQGSLNLLDGGKGKLKIIASGDFCPVNRVETLCREGNISAVYNDAMVLLQGGDIGIINLECPLTDKPNPIRKEGPNLMAHPDCLAALSQGGFNVVTLANNHIMDHDQNGLTQTIDECNRRCIKTVGAGKNLHEAANPLYLEVKNTRIAILNFGEGEFSAAGDNRPGANPLDPVQNYYQIKTAQQQADLVFLVIHGGNEHTAIPSPRMVKTCRFFADLGVTAIIGHHTHHASALELYRGTPIFYSLGNFLFDYPMPAGFSHWYEGYWIVIHINNENLLTRIEIHPHVQCREEVGLHLLKDEEKKAFLKRIHEYSRIIHDEKLLWDHWESYCQERRFYYLSNAFRLNRVQRLLFRNRTFFKNKKNRRHLLRLFGMYDCESHRDVIVEILRNEITRLEKDDTTRSSDIKANSPYSLSFILFWFALYYAPILNFYLPSTNFGPGIPDLGFHELILILWVLAAFIDRSIKNLTRRVHTPWITLLGIYSFIVIISVSWSRESYSSSNIRDLFYHIFVPFLFGYASTFYTLNEEFRRSLVKHATVGCVVLSLLGLINYITQYGGKIDEMRSAATLHNPNALAIFLVLNIPLVLYGIYKNVLNRNLGYLALIIILLGVLGTISRKGIITAGLSCAIFLVMKRNYKILLLSIILCALFITFSIGIEPIAKRFDEKKINEQIAGKWNMTLAGWNMFRQHPLKGLGYKGYYNEFGKYFRDSGRLKYDAHNNFITALANFGLIGIGPFLGIFLLPLKYSLNILKYFGRAISTDEQMRQLTGIAILIPFMFNAWFAGDLMYMAVITTVFYTLIGFFCISTPKSLPVATTAATLK